MGADSSDEYGDVNLVCSDCGREFVHTKEKQGFYESVGLKNLPKRCPECREKRRSSDRGPSKPRSQRQSRPWKSEPTAMFEAVCAECGKPAMLKFKPNGSRPVYCDECFRKRRR